jgi:hypothetical protein
MPHAGPALAGQASARDAWPVPSDDETSPVSGRIRLRPPLGLKPVEQETLSF